MEKMVSDNIQVEYNDDIFSFLEPNSNECLSKLNNSDRLNVLFLLKKYYLEKRKRLNIGDDITLGLEIEFEAALEDNIKGELEEFFPSRNWCMVPDGSLSNGAEINSPVLYDNEKSWNDLSHVCEIVNKNAYVMENTSAHVHIGVQILGNNPKYWRNFALLWATYENIIFRFLYGEYNAPRSRITDYAKPVSLDFINNLDRIKDRSEMLCAAYMFKVFDPGDDNVKLRRRKSVNFTNVSSLQSYMYDMFGKMNTIEYRSANGTFDPVIWQNNVNLLVKLMLYCKSDKFDEGIIIQRMNKIIENSIPSNIYKYSYIYIEQAIELADLIFDNNLDKVYFLRQYIKDGKVSNRPLDKSAPFTRRRGK